jgi:hypothetical protein
VEATLSNGFYPGLSAALLSRQIPAFIKVGLTTYRLGLTPFSSSGLFSSIPLTQVVLLMGTAFGQEDSARLYAAAGPVVRLTWPSGGTLTVDALAPLGLQVAVGFELPIGAGVRLFVEHTPTLYATPYPALFAGSVSGDTIGYLLGPSVALSLATFRYGIRWLL